MMPGMNIPGSGKPGAPFTINTAVNAQIHAPLPQFPMPSPTGAAPFPFNGMPMGMNVFGGATANPGSPSRPGSTAPGNRRNSGYHHRRPSNSRHSSQSRASSPFSPQLPNLNPPAPPTNSTQLSTSQSVKSSPKSKMRVPSSQSSNGSGPPISALLPTNTMPRSATSSSSRSSSVLGGYDIESGTPIDLAIAESDEAGEDDSIPEPLASAILKNPVKTGSTDGTYVRSPSRASNSRKEIQRLQSISPDASPRSLGGVAMNDVDESQRVSQSLLERSEEIS